MRAGDESHIRRDDPIRIEGSERALEATRIHSPKGVRLEIRSPHFEERTRLDALALESISWQDESRFPLAVADPDVTVAGDRPTLSASATVADEDRQVQIANEFAQVDVAKVRDDETEGLELRSPKLGFAIRLGVPSLESLVFQDPSALAAFLEDPYGPEDEH